MQPYSAYLSQKSTPQTEPIFGRTDQVQNSTGGFVFQIDKWAQLHRFLILGSEGGTYYATERKLTLENAQNVIECVKEDTPKAVKLITDISLQGRAPKVDPAIFALAIACTFGTDRSTAYGSIPLVCRTGTHLFSFCQCIQEFGKWGRGLRTAVGKFYKKDTDDLEYQLLKYKQRNGWTHRDVLRLCHVKVDGPTANRLLMEACGKQPKENQVVALLPERTMAVKALHSGNADAIEMIKNYSLTREMIPTELLAKKETWDALLHSMPVGALVRSLGKLSAVGVVDSNFAAATKYIADLLRNREILKKARLHPIAILNALRVYANGHGDKGKLSWKPVTAITEALDDAFYVAFDFVEPTRKNFCLGVDVSGSMDVGSIAGTALTPREAACAMMMVTARTEPNHEILLFSNGITKATIPPSIRLPELIAQTKRLPFSSTDCSLPMIVAYQQKWPVDCFVIYTDNETNNGSMHPCQALRQYRQALGRDAKAVVCAFTSTGFSIADPKDPGMMDVVGFDLNVPTVIGEFARG